MLHKFAILSQEAVDKIIKQRLTPNLKFITITVIFSVVATFIFSWLPAQATAGLAPPLSFGQESGGHTIDRNPVRAAGESSDLPLFSNWGLPMRINEQGSGFAAGPDVTVRDNVAYAVWVDNRTGKNEIFLAKSSGQSWAAGNTRVNSSLAEGESAGAPTIVVAPNDGDTIYVAWVVNSGPPNLTSEVHISRSSDGGQSWPFDTVVITGSTDDSFSLAVDNSGNLYLAREWAGDIFYGEVIDVMRSQDGGQSWSAATRAGELIDECQGSGWDLAASGSGSVYVVMGNCGVRQATSVNGGQSWSPSTLYNPDTVQAAAVAVDEAGQVYVVWQEETLSGSSDIFMAAVPRCESTAWLRAATQLLRPGAVDKWR